MADSIAGTLVAVDPVLVAAHFHQVVLAVWETEGILACGAAFSIGIKNAVGFQRSDHGDPFFHDLIPQPLTGIPAVHQGDDGSPGRWE